MKKVILGIALISQFSCTVEGIPEIAKLAKKENQSLVPINFFDNSKARFREQLDNSTQSVVEKFSKLNALPELSEEDRENQKLLAVIDEFCNLNKFCEGEFNLNRNKANEFFHQMLVTRAKDIMRDEIAQKEAEIVRLQGRLDELLKKSPQTAESLRRSDNSIRRAEEDVRRTKHATDNFDVSKYELLKERQINRTFERFSEKLNAIQNEVQESRDNLERTLRDVLEKTQKQYEDSTNILIGNIEDNYDDIIKEVEEKYKDQKRHLAEAYDRQIEAMNDKINEFTALNAGLEREKELHSLISRVFVTNKSLRAEKIMIRSAEINRMTDIFKKRAAVQAEYSKFELFSGLLGREDLGISAKQDDLTKVSEYLNNTRISQKPAMPTLIREVFWARALGFFLGEPHPVFPDEGFIRGKYGLTHILAAGGGLLGHYEERMTVDWYNRCKDIENTERRNAYNNAMSAWNAEVSRASTIPFPAGEFDRLVEQFNVFVSKL